MKKKVYIVRLSEEEKKQLKEVIRKGKHPARQITRAHLLLALDAGGTEITVREIAQRYQCGTGLVSTVAKQYVQEGLQRVITRKQRETPPVPKIATGEVEAKIIALSCSEPPEGRSRWTLRLLEEKVVELGIVPKISDTTIRDVLKKTR
jgi:transposase